MRRSNGSPIRTVPPEALAAALRHAYDTSPRDGMIIETLLETGIRNQELRLLVVGDLWRASQVPLSLVLRPEIAKNSRKRTIPLTAIFRRKMAAYIAGLPGPEQALDENAALFPSQHGGGHLTRRGLCRIVMNHFSASGYPATPHMLRHTAATELLRVCNARVVQLVLGHKRLDTVQIYTHPTDQDLRAAMEARAAAKRPRTRNP